MKQFLNVNRHKTDEKKIMTPGSGSFFPGSSQEEI